MHESHSRFLPKHTGASQPRCSILPLQVSLSLLTDVGSNQERDMSSHLSDYATVLGGSKNGHRPLSLKILYIEFFLTLDFLHEYTYIEIMRPYYSVQMRFDVCIRW